MIGVCLLVSLFFSLFVSEQHNSKTYGWIFFKFSHIVYIIICLSKISDKNFADVNVTVAYSKATLKFMGPLPGRRSVFYECNSIVGDGFGT